MATAVETSFNAHNGGNTLVPGTANGTPSTNTTTPTSNNHDNASSTTQIEGAGPNQDSQEAVPEVDIVINNVVCSFSVRCHLNLRDIALRGVNVEYRKENGMVTMKLRRPYTTASMWSSGKITCTGANSEEQARIAARRYARLLQKLGFRIRFKNFRVVNVLGTCTLPFGIKIANFSQAHRQASYEPELHPGVTYKMYHPKATLKIFSTGSITVTAPSVRNVQAAIEHIFPLVDEHKKPKTSADIKKPIPDLPQAPPPVCRKRKHSSNDDILYLNHDREQVYGRADVCSDTEQDK
ncbi:TATA box-binding protein-like 1 [Lepeophtheirus salmonis]|uniref:TATA box-binding protein-like 1 n=1 Tax=Lepeophtheirus salmonis TaxID=72036 RepID=A0A0K2USJ3_LEPSM|nr:TATA box-binding protein-like 1 [Lepeophtheirus salmonis]XP_040581722.1 TATA box-binding protein-like 1 [Lepeophtheirus salmonis]XP_040581723.1 TATA box-binding protein-like 1 [Lepeophtheirus salmonis]XP_040581724.1 TATA box-binding protein-like 1 [Lepeophtheirus salmonis]